MKKQGSTVITKVWKEIDSTHKIESGIFTIDGTSHEMLYFNAYTMKDPIKELKKAFLDDKLTQQEYFAKKDALKDAKPELKVNTFISKSFSKSKLQLILDNLDIVREFVGR